MTDLDTGAEAPADDLRSALESAWTAAETSLSTTGPPKQEPKPDSASSDAAPVKSEQDDSRDELGRFKAKDEKPDAEKPVSADQEKTAGTGEQKPATRKPPTSWPKEVHDHWDKLDPAIQDQILKREDDIAKGFEKKDARYKPYDELEPLLAPKRQFWRLNGWSDAQAIQQLLAAQDYLERDAAGAIRWLASSYGVRPEQLVQQTAASNQADPLAQYLAPVFQKLQQLEGSLTAQQQAEQTRTQSAIQRDLESFSKDHPHFEAVRHDMGVLLESGRANDLKDAYDKAVWLNPDIRKQILGDQAKAQAVKNAEEVEKAKRAASSVTGAPTGGSARTGPALTLREELEAAWDNP